MPFMTVRVTGLVESIRGLSDVMRRSPETNRQIINEATDLFERTAKSKVHVITGKTKRSTRKLTATSKYGIIESKFGAFWEEKREGSKGSLGPHKFLTETARVVKAEMPDIIRRYYADLFRSV